LPQILSVSYDTVLLHTRQMLLEASGYSVTSAEGYVDAIKKCRAREYDLLIIGHSIPHADKESIIAELHQHCPAPVLALLRPNEPTLVGATESIEVGKPNMLVEAVARILRSPEGTQYSHKTAANEGGTL
jgi:CheY-like chemotaxis protein